MINFFEGEIINFKKKEGGTLIQNILLMNPKKLIDKSIKFLRQIQKYLSTKRSNPFPAFPLYFANIYFLKNLGENFLKLQFFPWHIFSPF